MRSAERICSLPAGVPVPQRPGVVPWGFSAEELRAAMPARRDAAAAWLLLLDEPEGLSLPDWVGLLQADPAALHQAAGWLWLQGGQQLFRWRQQRVTARSVADLRNLRHERRRNQLAQQAHDHWHQLIRHRQPIDLQGLGPAQQQELGLLHAWAAAETSPPLPAELRKALQAAHCPPERGSIRHLLVDLGQWDAHHLPSLQSTPWQLGFSPELEAMADQLLASHEQSRPSDGQRHDLTHLATVTIDDVDTQDIDDGLALEQREGGAPRLWIHVADPGRLVAAGDPLDLEARRRASSLYLSRGNLPMFPLPLANGPFSLRAGQRCAAWSVWVDLAADGAIAASGVQRSWVKPRYRLSYDDADELIELAPPQERELEQIHALMARRRQWRVQQGALLLDQAEGRIRARDGEACLEITEPGPSRLMVAEAMILAGAVVGELGRLHGLALPFRSQLPAELPAAAELARLADGPVRHAAIKRCLSRGITGTSPAAHFSLGLPAYVQATSPIRRYADLVVQRQLEALLAGGQALDAAALQELLSTLEGPLRQGIQISREDQRHWQQVWFEQHRGQQWRAQFLRWLRPHDRLALVHVEELAMDLAAECPADAEPGAALLLRVQLVDALRDQLRLRASA
ncbi:MAG: RNB domain-containing ribonuclease [Cyanobacteriota bacterium]|nr:RNB domain-containing ribonuclease [Cyanobacteriota bacterium]